MFIGITSFLVCYVVTVLLQKFLAKGRLATVKERPMFLGLAIYITILITLFCTPYYLRCDDYLLKILIGASLILYLGIIDDIKGLSVMRKLIGQIIVASVAVSIGIKTSIYYIPGWGNAIVTVVWIVALMNALNLIDIMDGLCTGVSLIMSVSFLIVSIVSKDIFVSTFFWVLTGALALCLLYNFPPAKLYLGDSGSMLLGFLFAASALHISYAPDFSHGLSLFVPALIVAPPLYDLAFTIFMRRKKNIPIVKKSKDHLVFILEGFGLGQRKILMLMYSASFLFGLSALLVKVLPSFFKAIFLMILSICMVFLTAMVSRLESRLMKR